MMTTKKRRELVERVTVYLTSRNRKRLANLRRGEKTKTINAALDHAFEKAEKQHYFAEFMGNIKQIKPMAPLISSIDATRNLRDGRDHDIHT